MVVGEHVRGCPGRRVCLPGRLCCYCCDIHAYIKPVALPKGPGMPSQPRLPPARARFTPPRAACREPAPCPVLLPPPLLRPPALFGAAALVGVFGEGGAALLPP